MRKLKKMLDVCLQNDVIQNGVIFLETRTDDSGFNNRLLIPEVRVQTQGNYLTIKYVSWLDRKLQVSARKEAYITYKFITKYPKLYLYQEK
jgi:hypothetical protein